MATVKQIRRRIRSVQSTKQITKAMEMVAAAKLRKAQARAESARPYAETMERVLANLSGAARTLSHPLFETRDGNRVLLLVVSSDKGLCGAFNSNVFKFAEKRIVELGRENVRLIPIGKRAYSYFQRRDWDVSEGIAHLGDSVDLTMVRRLGRDSVDLFLGEHVDRVECIYTRFITAARRVVEVVPIVPVVPAESEDAESAASYIFEPDPETIFNTLLPRYISTTILSILADSLAAEFSARMIAMGNATQNADEMISSLTLTANKLRQAAITKELLEIVSGAAALE
jgi:F-type H+-transporting ATPase subunit gamma